MLSICGPIIGSAIRETYLLSATTFQTLIAARRRGRWKPAAAGRCGVRYAAGAHSGAGVLGGARFVYWRCAGTSNTLGGVPLCIPVMARRRIPG